MNGETKTKKEREKFTKLVKWEIVRVVKRHRSHIHLFTPNNHADDDRLATQPIQTNERKMEHANPLASVVASVYWIEIAVFSTAK